MRPTSASSNTGSRLDEERHAWIRGFTMMWGSEGPTTSGSALDSSDNIIEPELTVGPELALSRAAETAPATARPDDSGPVSSVREYENFTCGRTARIDFVCNLTFAVAVLGTVVAFLWR
jgi:hypothetical protein